MSTAPIRQCPPDLVQRLRDEVAGVTVCPDDDGFSEACSAYLGDIDTVPSAVVRPEDAAAVAVAVTIAADLGMAVGVRCGGHSVHALGPEGGLLIDVSALGDIAIDPDASMAWAGAGVTCGEYTERAGQLGLATGFGDTGTVGLAGLTLGGGIGYLVRSHGLTADQLLAAEVVTMDGRVRIVDTEREPDLFWALRGGGGNFAIVTRLALRLHPLTTVTAGLLVLPATPDVLSRWVSESRRAPRTVSSILNVMPAPEMPFLPSEVVGTLVAMAMVVHSGEPADAAADLSPLRSLAEPLADLIEEVPYPAIYPAEDEDYHPVAATHTLLTDELDEVAATHIIEALDDSGADMPAVQIRVLGGALADVDSRATAFAHRDRQIMVIIAAMYSDRSQQTIHEQWARGLGRRLRVGPDAAYVNFLGREAAERITAAYPGWTLDRLRRIKGRYDPDNLLRGNVNIT